ncbi:unnamed protein product [Sordaria macrospora k-hell]|uniref:WGS project CABT00000000 data, contig 2.1 n=2 Tax=Sordaria macrospora TaxID=5147 RepID=F7VM25_SORMK|nr:uncharacterized protein SMAC_07436 [Sordaria macrospora k-hell]CCC06553.1 unnamed protein product [Sordaria macrospora k-hell]
MAGFGLTSPTSGQQPPSAFDTSRFSDSESEEPASRSPARTPSEFLSSAFRGIKKITPGRDDFARLTRQPSQLGLRRPSEPYIPTAERPPISSPINIKSPNPFKAQHARTLSLQNSLAKSLPEPPPPTLSPTSPSTPTSFPQLTQQPLETIVDTEESWADSSRPSTMDSSSSMEMGGGGMYMRSQDTSRQDVSMSSSQSSFASVHRSEAGDGRHENLTPRSNGPMSAGPSPNGGQGRPQAAGGGGPQPMPSPSQHLSGLMCNVHRTTGREPPPLVGATTTVLGRQTIRLDLIRRHWSKIETSGDVPPPRYFHSMCALGDTKLVCYGGMSPISNQNTITQDQQPEVKVMSDIYIYDAQSRKWAYVQTQDAPQGRYAHCACILPSSAAFASHRAPFSALQHNPSSGNPNEGRIGINIDGTGGAEMVVIGGQDAANHYIEQISVFNLRSLKWVSTEQLGKSCGAYRSVVAPLPPSLVAKIGKPHPVNGRQDPAASTQEAKDAGSSMLIYSNYNFLDVKLELQVRSSDGTLVETTMKEQYSPPGLRFPNGGIIDHYFVVSGTYLTSSKQEYALWALDLRNLSWSRIDAGGAVFSQGSWNRGVLWNRRNTFVVLGHRKRSLVDDYNHRRINFSNVCMVELEAFGFYDNPRKTAPMSGFVSASSPFTGPGLSLARKAGFTAGGRQHSRAAEELGEKALTMRELADMDILCIGGERIPVNSRIVARRWGPYFVQLLREGTACQDGSDVMTLRSNSISASSGMGRSSNMTPTPGNRSTMESNMSVYSGGSSTGKPPSTAATSIAGSIMSPTGVDAAALNSAPTPRTLAPNNRPRCLYLPHTFLTIQALLHFLYTSNLPQPTSPLCTPQILCSLLQIARPYRVDGLLEAVVERLHNLLDSRNAAAVFNATAMAAGGGRGIDGTLNPNFFPPADLDGLASPIGSMPPSANGSEYGAGGGSLAARTTALHINTAGLQQDRRPPSEELSATNSVSGSEWSDMGEHERERGGEIWSGELSSVIGLQKRGLRGLMEGRRMRERTGTNPGMMGPGGPGPSGHGGPGGPGFYGSTPTATSSMQQMQQRVGMGMGGP